MRQLIYPIFFGALAALTAHVANDHSALAHRFILAQAQPSQMTDPDFILKDPFPPASKSFLLMVTWLVHDQPPNTTRLTFTSFPACETARAQIIKDAERMRQEMLDQVGRAANGSGFPPDLARLNAMQKSPSVSAVCLAQ